jgi:hypothetical protein
MVFRATHLAVGVLVELVSDNNVSWQQQLNTCEEHGDRPSKLRSQQWVTASQRCLFVGAAQLADHDDDHC